VDRHSRKIRNCEKSSSGESRDRLKAPSTTYSTRSTTSASAANCPRRANTDNGQKLPTEAPRHRENQSIEF